MTFAILVLLTAIIGSSMVTARVVQAWPMSISKRIVLFAGVFFMWLTPIFVIHRPQTLTASLYTGIVDILYFIFIFAVLIFFFMILRDVLWLCLWQTAHFFKKKFPKPTYIPVLKKANILLFIFVFILSGYALYEGKKIPDIKTVDIITPKITRPTSIAVLSDLHLSRHLSRKKLTGIVQRTLLQKPDLIVLPGDTVDDFPKFIQPHLDILSQLKAPLGVYVVAGNHEFYIGHNNSQEALKKTGMTYLFNTGILINNDIFLIGVPDSKAVRRFGQQADIKNTLKNKGNHFTVLLSHQPKFIDTLDKNSVDLQISGHTHGGQIFPFQFIAKLANTYLSGLYKINDTFLYVSRGSGQWGPQMRLFAPSEITIIRLLPLI